MDRLRIKKRLLEKNLTLVQLARLAGLNYDRVVRVVNNYRPARDHELRAIADALGVSPARIQGRSGPAGEQRVP